MKVYIVVDVRYGDSQIKAVFDTYEKAILFVDWRLYDIYEWEINTTNGCII